MILGITGPMSSDMEMVLDCVLKGSALELIDTNDIIRAVPNRNYKNSLIVDDTNKKVLLKNLENHMGSLVATSNLVLTENVCKWLLSNGHSVAIVARSNLTDYDPVDVSNQRKYWGDEDVLKFELEDRYKELYNRLSTTNSENLYWIDLSTDSEDLDRLCERMSNEKSTKYDINNIINQFNKDEDRMTIQESIQKAMKELGIDLNTTEGAEKKVTTKPPKKEIKEVSADTTIIKEPKPPLEANSNTSTDNSKPMEPTTPNELYVKITADAMAIMIPTELKMDTREIGGDKFYVATVALPDLNSRSLQVLRAVSGNNQTKPVSQLAKGAPKAEDKPVEPKPKAEPKPRSHIIVSGVTLEELTAEKHEWDAKIKEARSAGNADLVNEYRKHRRAVRSKINELKKLGDVND